MRSATQAIRASRSGKPTGKDMDRYASEQDTAELLAHGCAGLNIADLRPHTADWPALQAMRCAPTQELARDLESAGFNGALYLSAQRPGSDCLALFDAAAIVPRR